MEGAPDPGPWGYAACYFGSNPSGKTYDYIAPFPVDVGDVVKVPSNRGEGWTRVTVAEIKQESEVARVAILEIIPPEPEEGDDDGE